MGNQEEVVCPVCGEAYGTFEQWLNHSQAQQVVESSLQYPIASAHLSLNVNDIEVVEALESQYHPTLNLSDLQQYFQSEISEVIVVVKGIDPLMSGMFQSLHLY